MLPPITYIGHGCKLISTLLVPLTTKGIVSYSVDIPFALFCFAAFVVCSLYTSLEVLNHFEIPAS